MKKLNFAINLKYIISLIACIFINNSILYAQNFQDNSIRDPKFMLFIEDFKQKAKNEGIDQETLDLAFNNITAPYPNTIHNTSHQPEFNLNAATYLSTRLTSERVEQGKYQQETYDAILNDIENKFGVDRAILLAIWGNETNYGAALKNDKIMKDGVRALASLAYYKSHYNNYAKQQLMALLKILQKKYLNRDEIKTSWAGAIGQTQFIPTSYLLYAVDMSGNGKSDIVNNIADALATTANLLAKNGWHKDEKWIYEIDPAYGKKIKKLSGQTKTLAQWAQLGLWQSNQHPLPINQNAAKLNIIAGEKPRYILTTHNFNVIKAYNKSDLYAVSVGLLANRIKS